MLTHACMVSVRTRACTQIGTPVYMSPELISCKSSKSGYDATKADVWACGILLFVMLLGMFPYDHTEHPDPNSSDAHVEVRSMRMAGHVGERGVGQMVKWYKCVIARGSDGGRGGSDGGWGRWH